MWKMAARHSGDAEISQKQKEVRSAELMGNKNIAGAKRRADRGWV